MEVSDPLIISTPLSLTSESLDGQVFGRLGHWCWWACHRMMPVVSPSSPARSASPNSRSISTYSNAAICQLSSRIPRSHVVVPRRAERLLTTTASAKQVPSSKGPRCGVRKSNSATPVPPHAIAWRTTSLLATWTNIYIISSFRKDRAFHVRNWQNSN